jgi:hypothetical protein
MRSIISSTLYWYHLLARALVSQRRNHIAKTCQTLVDGRSLFQSIACGPSAVGSLRPSKIHKIDLRTAWRLFARYVLADLLKHHSHNCMCTTRCCIHVCCRHSAIGCSCNAPIIYGHRSAICYYSHCYYYDLTILLTIISIHCYHCCLMHLHPSCEQSRRSWPPVL